MDNSLELPSTSSLFGSVTSAEFDNIKTMWAPPTVQETWLGAGGESGSADDGFLGSLDAGGALMSAGGSWSLSTLPGEEGLRWTGAVKTEQEVFDEWAGAGGVVPLQRQAILHPSPLLGAGQATAAEAAAAAAGTASEMCNAKPASLAKPDAEDGWKSFVDPAPSVLSLSRDTKRLDGETGIAAASAPLAAVPTAPPGALKLPGSWPAATYSAGSSTRDNIAALKRQRSSPPTAPAATQAPAPAPATTATPAPPLPRAAAKTRARAAAPAPPPSRDPPTTVTTRTRRSAAAAAASRSLVKAELVEEEDEDGGEEEEEEEDDDDEDYTAGAASARKSASKKKAAPTRAADSEDDFDLDEDPVGSELTDKRRRNREHAKRSRLRKRVRLGGLEEMVLGLRRENVRLRQMVMRGIPDRAGSIIRACAKDNTNADLVAKQDVVQGMRPGMSVGAGSSSWSARGGTRSRPKLEGGSSSRRGSGGRGGGPGGGSGSKDRRVPSALKLMSPCYQTVKALAESQANFILTNPNLPDCPIIFASQGFLELTGYEGKDVIGRNCRFLQGPGTDEETLSIVRNSVEAGRDASVCILNYKKDGTPFWNQLSIGVLLDAHGQVANHVAVMYEVNPMAPAVFHRLLHRVPLPESLLNDDSSSESDGDGTSNHRRDPVERSEVAAGSFNHSCAGGISSRSSTAGGDGGGSGAGVAAPRVVDRLRRTRAAAAAISNGNGGNK